MRYLEREREKVCLVTVGCMREGRIDRRIARERDRERMMRYLERERKCVFK